MIDEDFKRVMQFNLGCAVIMAGSDSDDKPKEDKPSHIEQIARSLESFEIPYEVRICSAHKQDVEGLVNEYNNVGGSYAIVAVAGGTDALSGTASFHAYAPVISCPPDTRYADKEKYQNDFNESCLKNPPGSSNSYIARPENVGRFIAQMYAGINPKFRDLLMASKTKKMISLDQADKTIHDKYKERQAK